MTNTNEIPNKNLRSDITTRFWRSVDAKLKEANISRAELSRRASLSNQSLTSAKYLKSRINIFTALRIAKALDCTIGELIIDSPKLSELCEDERYAGLIKEVKEEAGSNGILKLAKLFENLSEDEQLAVLVHTFSLIGLSPNKTLEKIITTEGDVV